MGKHSLPEDVAEVDTSDEGATSGELGDWPPDGADEGPDRD